MRPIFALLVLVALCPAARAQPPIEPVNGVITVPLALTPRPAKPLTQVRLMPDFRDRVPGNRVQGFMKLFFEQNRYFHDPEVAKQDEKDRAAPLSELKDRKGGVPSYVPRIAQDAAYAARMRDADWQIDEIMRRDGFGTLLPEVQSDAPAWPAGSRSIARVATGQRPAARRARTPCPHPVRPLAHLPDPADAHRRASRRIAIGSIACQSPRRSHPAPRLPEPVLGAHESAGAVSQHARELRRRVLTRSVRRVGARFYRGEQVAERVATGVDAARARGAGRTSAAAASCGTRSSLRPVTFRALYAIRAADAGLSRPSRATS